MAETQPKRQREETHDELESVGETCNSNSNSNKRQKYSYNDILSLLDSSEEEEQTQDLSSLITTLQQELSPSESGFDPVRRSGSDPENPTPTSSSSSSSSSLKEDDHEDDRESVMRHLLEASDDELGIPNRNDASFSGNENDEFEGLGLADHCLWELEDEAANYYTLLQSELFM